MFTDPQSITIDGTANSLPRVSSQGRSSTYESPDGAVTMTITHVNKNRTRSVLRLDHKKIDADPLVVGAQKPYSMSAYLTVDTPFNVGYTDAEVGKIVAGLLAKASTAGFMDKFLGQES